MFRNISPLTRADVNRASQKNLQDDFTKAQNKKPSKRHITSSIKCFLVTLGANRILPRRLCAWLINVLGLRGE